MTENPDKEVFQAIEEEKRRQHEHIELIASENYASPQILAAQGSYLTNKYAEGYPNKRWYGGCEFVDKIETLAITRAKTLFEAEHANVQPHSGSQTNMAVYFGYLSPNDKILTMDLGHGGHLTHGHKANFSGKLYQVHHYGVRKDNHRMDYDELATQAKKIQPKLITAGASAYPRQIDFPALRDIANSVNALLLVDMAHIAGLVAGGVHPSPIPYADFVTTTTHKSLRGPRSGLILCKESYSKKIDSQVFPGIQGGPLMHVIAAKAICFHEALQPSFKTYAKQVVTNAKKLAETLKSLGHTLISGGTDNHLLLLDIRPLGLNGEEACQILGKIAITVNKNAIPYDTEPITNTGGIRIGTPAITTRGMKESHMEIIGEWINSALRNPNNETLQKKLKAKVHELTSQFPLTEE